MIAQHDKPLQALREHYQQAMTEGDAAAKTCTLATVENG